MDLKKINSNIKLIARNSDKLNKLIHTTAVGVLVHAQEHGDCTAALRLVQAMPVSHRRGLLINWFALYSPIGMNVANGKVGFHKPEAKAYKPFDVETAEANPFYNSAEAQKEDLPDTTLEAANKMIFAVATKLQKQLDDGRVAANDRDAVVARIADLKAIGKAAVAAAKVAPVEQEAIAA